MDLRSIKNLFSGQGNGHHHKKMGDADPSYGVWIALLMETKVSLFYWKENPGALAFFRNGWVCGRGWEDPLEEGMATHSRFLAWTIPWTEEPGGLQSTGSQRVRHDSVTKRAHTVTALADQGRPAGSAAAEGFQAQLSRLPDAVLGGSIGRKPWVKFTYRNWKVIPFVLINPRWTGI